MVKLNQGTTISLTTGQSIDVIKELGRGGQGIVYLVRLDGAEYALKWYTVDYPDSFYKNLENNVNNGAPKMSDGSHSKAFLWPMLLTQRQLGSFGYVMKLRPAEYKDFSDFLLAKVSFKSLNSMINAALQICDGFSQLHRAGYSYQDLNDGNFFIKPDTGDVLICDNDNVSAQGHSTGISGKMRYMAPEIVSGEKPNKYSDYFSLSVVLFFLFYYNHPLEGKRVLSSPCMTESLERKHYGTHALFIYDQQNKDNLPVRGVHTNVIKRWPLFSEILQNIFKDQFSQNRLKNPTTRMMESEWIKKIIELRNRIVICPNCGEETFSGQNGNSSCIHCNHNFNIKYYIHTNTCGKIALTPGTKIFLGNEKRPIALIKQSKKDPNILGIQNILSKEWVVETPSGKIKKVSQNEVMPSKPGLKIQFPFGIKAKII